MTLNNLGQAIVSSGNEAEYDAAVKEILADKQVLAWILKWTTNEFKDMGTNEIETYIENPMVAKIPVFPGLTNEAIEGMRNESKINHEGLVTYDVRFSVTLPQNQQGKVFRIIVDVEAQKDPHPGYDLITRGVFYGGRMLSDQMGRNLDGEDYDKLEKVYSIWIVFNCPQKNANTTTAYRIKQETVYGSMAIKSRYDLLTVVEVRLPSEEDYNKCVNAPTVFHNLLFDIFVRKENADEKLKRLEEKYNLRTKKMERGIGIMCNLSEKIKEEAEKNTEKKLNSLYKWLFDNGRSADVQKAIVDSSYLETLLKEMDEAMVVLNV